MIVEDVYSDVLVQCQNLINDIKGIESLDDVNTRALQINDLIEPIFQEIRQGNHRYKETFRSICTDALNACDLKGVIPVADHFSWKLQDII